MCAAQSKKKQCRCKICLSRFEILSVMVVSVYYYEIFILSNFYEIVKKITIV